MYINDSNKSGWVTQGDHSPIAGRDVNITYGEVGTGQRTRMAYGKGRKSWITSERATWLAFLATMVSLLLSVYTVIDWGEVVSRWKVVGRVVREANGGGLGGLFDPVAGAMSTTLWLVARLALAAAILIAAWKYARRRRQQFPVIKRRFSVFRSLLPVQGQPGKFVRANAAAECLECVDLNRPGVFARVRQMKINGTMRVGFACRNGHKEPFREKSIFAPPSNVE